MWRLTKQGPSVVPRARVRLVVLAVLLALLVAGCGGGTSASPVASEPSTEETRTEKTPAPEPPSVDAEAPEPGTELVSVNDPGRVNVISNGNGFSIVDSVMNLNPERDESHLTTYNAAGEELTEIPSGRLAGECGAADVVVPGVGRMIITEIEGHTETEGIYQTEFPTVLKAWSAENGTPIWSAPMRYGEGEEWEEPGCGAYDGYLEGFTATADGRWGVFGGTDPEFGGARVIDLKTGQVQPDLHAEGVLGNYPIMVPESPYGPQRYKAIDPIDGQVLGVLTTDADFYQQQEQLSMAARGVLEWDGSGASPTAMSSDGERLILVEGPESGEPHTVAYTLPDFQVAWQRPPGESPSLVAEGGGIVIESAGGGTGLVGLNDQTGKREWSLPGGEVCGLTDSQMVLSINEQLATIDLKTGEQLSYEEGEEGCPTILPGGIAAYVEGGEVGEMTGLTVVQALTP